MKFLAAYRFIGLVPGPHEIIIRQHMVCLHLINKVTENKMSHLAAWSATEVDPEQITENKQTRTVSHVVILPCVQFTVSFIILVSCEHSIVLLLMLLMENFTASLNLAKCS